MNKLMQWLAIQIRSIHQYHRKAVKRELIITLTVALGLVLQFSLFSEDNRLSYVIADAINTYANIAPQEKNWTLYYTHLATNFTKSFIMIIVCFAAVMITNSKRLAYGLTTFLVVSMGMDLLSVVSTDYYYLIKYYRYDTAYNFKDLYTAFEVTCVLFFFINTGLTLIKAFLGNYHDRHVRDCSHVSLENIHPRSTKEA